MSDDPPKPHPRMPAITRDPVTGEHGAVEPVEPVVEDDDGPGWAVGHGFVTAPVYR